MLDLRSVKVLVFAALAMVLVLTTNFSTAAFTSSSTNTATVSAAADWTLPTVKLGLLAALVKGDVTVTADASDRDSGIASVTIERRATGSGAWTAICAGATSPASCAWDTTGVSDGDHEVRASATDRAGNSAQTATASVKVDNTAPTVTMKDPGSPLRGTRTFDVLSVNDATSGVATVHYQAAPRGTGEWRTLCTSPALPWSCTQSTTMLVNGRYDFRAIATDKVGHTATSATVNDRLVDNVGHSVSVKDPGAILTGTTALAVSVTSPSNVTSVKVRYAPIGTTAWSDVPCTGAAPSYTCTWDTTKAADGRYDLQAVMVDGTGTQTLSTVLSDRRVLNTLLRGADIQAVNGGGVAGQIDVDDTVTFTYAGHADLSTVLPGWTGAPTTVTVLLRDVAEVETLEVSGTSLGVVSLNGNYSKRDRTLPVKASLRASTDVVDGKSWTTVTVVLTELSSGHPGTLEKVSTPTTLTWAPSTAVKDLLGRASSSQMATELGTADVDF